MKAWTGWRIGQTSALEFGALFLLSLFMALLGPFQTAEAILPVRLSFWIIAMMGGGVIAALIEPLLVRIPILAASPHWRGAVQALVMTVPVTLFVDVARRLLLGSHLGMRSYADLFPQVFVVDVGVVLLAWMIRSLTRAPVPKSGPAPNPLADRLPPAQARARLIAIEAEDHYLRVHTQAGASLVYMRLADALDAAAQGDGLQVHRSWWVARAAVQSATWRDGRGELSLSNGLKVPVSRSFAKTVKATRWAETD